MEKAHRSMTPAAMTARRFFKNRLAAVGLGILAFLFLFSFLGGWLNPYGQDQVFYRQEDQTKAYAGAAENRTFQFTLAPGEEFGPVLQAKFTLHRGSVGTFTHEDIPYTIEEHSPALYTIRREQKPVALAHLDIVTPALPFAEQAAVLLAYSSGGEVPESVHISRLAVRPAEGSGELPADFRLLAQEAIEADQTAFTWEDRQFTIRYDAPSQIYQIRQQVSTRVYDAYASPSRLHLLGTDKNGMDMLTRLQYGGRVSLVIGFLVVAIAAVIGVILGGIAGFFGGWADELVMRIVDIFYCIPSTPVLIILGAAMDGMRMDPTLRMLYLMLLLGFLGWPGIARMVRGQILSLREQEFMTATRAAGLGAGRRIFRHLIPNVVPQLMVTCTMSLGSTILTEATLSFLGLGVKFPFASWGNIMNDVASAHVLTSYWFVWIPAGVCLMLAVLGFNFVGDGLRDAFDPRTNL